MPQWSKDEVRAPLSIKILGGSLLLPLLGGAAAVHFAGDDLAGLEAASAEAASVGAPAEEGLAEAHIAELGAAAEASTEYSRAFLSFTLHYAGALLSCAGACHWGLQLAEFGVPRRSDYMALYYLSRFSAPVVFVFFGWLGSVLSTAEPREASLWLLTGYVGLLSYDFLAKAFHIAPPWWFRWRAGLSLTAIGSILVLLLSERNLYIGQKPMIRM